jgi:hypothetical protein
VAIIYDYAGNRIGEIDYSGTVTDDRACPVGNVSSVGGGEVHDLNWRVGDVSGTGEVTNLEGDLVGSVSGITVYDERGSKVGSVDADTTTSYVTGITEAHQAGAALLLLLKHG